MSEDERSAEAVRVDRRTSAERPQTVTVEIPPSVARDLDGEGTPGEVVGEFHFVNIQLAAGSDVRYLNIRAEWPAPSPSDIDITLFGEGGGVSGQSDAFNPLGLGRHVWPEDTGGDGWEEIRDIPAGGCDSFTLQIEPFLTPGESLTVKLWTARI